MRRRSRSPGVVIVSLCVSLGVGCDEEVRRPDGAGPRDGPLAEARAGDGPRRDGGAGDRTAGEPSQVPLVSVQPKEIADLLANPGMGWETFHHVASNDPSLAGLPSGVAYYRWTWKDLEPSQGSYNVALVKDTLAKARAAGQTLAFRVMTAGDDSVYSPAWLPATGCKVLSYSAGGPTLEAADLDDPTCFARHAALLAELGKQLAKEPDLQLDIGSVGLWGEWHFSGTTPQVPMPSLATRKKLIDLYFSTFPGWPLLALIGDTDALGYAVSKGAGWRADCFGDYGFFSATWNHMDHMYKQHLATANANDAWKQGPVAWESCGVMSDWVQKGFDVHKIFSYGLDLHGSLMNNKSSTLPAGAPLRTEIESFVRKLGYRFVLRELSHPATLTRGAPAGEVAMRFENVGVAPCYADYRVAFRLTPSSGKPVVVIGKQSVRSWLPGSVELREAISADAALPAGSASLAVALVDGSGVPRVRLAIAGRDASGWYPLSTLTLK